jgi:sugar/nucleoside kinase (ribokinase family)
MVSVYGVENPLMDFITHVEHAFVASTGKNPGSMNLVEKGEAESLLARIGEFRNIAGGSAANTIRGIAWLAGGELPPPVFNGAVGKDDVGDRYGRIMERAGVHAVLRRKDARTGISLILVTPDGERTMLTYLGACREFGPADLDPGLLAGSRILHLTGYLWDTEGQKAAAGEAVDIARKAGRRILLSLDIADPFVARRYRKEFLDWIPGKVDLLFGNREELSQLTGEILDERVLRRARELSPMIVMKTGAEGCLACHGAEETRVGTQALVPKDTTGAGDAFAAGFLHGMLLGKTMEECARRANALAAAICCVEGCDYAALDRGRFRI